MRDRALEDNNGYRRSKEGPKEVGPGFNKPELVQEASELGKNDELDKERQKMGGKA